jgi:hypothetical protein
MSNSVQNLSIAGNSTVSGSLTSNSLIVASTSQLNGAVTTLSDLNIGGNISHPLINTNNGVLNLIGNIAFTPTSTFSTGTGAVTLNGNTAISGTKILKVNGDTQLNTLTMSGVLTATNNMTVGGNLGIKTANPAYPLDVHGDVQISGNLNLSNSGSSLNVTSAAQFNNTTCFGTPSTLSNLIVYSTPTFNRGINIPIGDLVAFGNTQLNTLTTGLLTVANNLTVEANIGIRTTNPAYPLDVNGDVQISGNLNISNSGSTLRVDSLAQFNNTTSFGTPSTLSNLIVYSKPTF